MQGIERPMNLERKKVLFFIPSLAGGGAQRVFSSLLRHLNRDLFELHLALLQAAGPYMQDVPKDVVIHDLGISRVRYALPRIARLVWKLRPHTILSTLGHLNLALTLCKPFLPRGTRLLIREAWSVSAPLEQMQHPERWNWLYRRSYNRADIILCQTDTMVSELIDHFKLPRKKLVRIYNPIDIERVRESAEIDGNPFFGPGPHLVTAGRLSWEKGYDVLVEAMPAVLQSLPNAQLLILGEGPRQCELHEQAKKLGLTEAVHFLGFQQNPWRYFRHADVFVLSSRYDALPNALLEALALGTPVVATDCPGGIREIHDDSGRMVLVPPENPFALAEAIVCVCSKQRCEYLKTSPEVLKRFGLHRIVDQYAALF
jgi:glycosyltransferase involved in cell wall biosynthesis